MIWLGAVVVAVLTEVAIVVAEGAFDVAESCRSCRRGAVVAAGEAAEVVC
jgi:hypothetical protein